MTKKTDKKNGVSKNDQPTVDDGLDTSTNSNKRTTLKTVVLTSSVVAGSGMLPGKWSSPVVRSIVLPAHAQATGPGGDGTTTTTSARQDPEITATLIRKANGTECGNFIQGKGPKTNEELAFKISNLQPGDIVRPEETGAASIGVGGIP